MNYGFFFIFGIFEHKNSVDLGDEKKRHFDRGLHIDQERQNGGALPFLKPEYASGKLVKNIFHQFTKIFFSILFFHQNAFFQHFFYFFIFFNLLPILLINLETR